MRRRIRTSVTFMLVLQTTRVHVPGAEDADAFHFAIDATPPEKSRAASSRDSVINTTTASRGRPPLRLAAPPHALDAAARVRRHRKCWSNLKVGVKTGFPQNRPQRFRANAPTKSRHNPCMKPHRWSAGRLDLGQPAWPPLSVASNTTWPASWHACGRQDAKGTIGSSFAWSMNVGVFTLASRLKPRSSPRPAADMSS